MSIMFKKKCEDCLYWYLQTIKDLGRNAVYAKKDDLYCIAGEKVYLSSRQAARIIRKLLQNSEVVERVSRRVE